MHNRHPTYEIRNGKVTLVTGATASMGRGQSPIEQRRAPERKPLSREQEIKAAAEAARRKDPSLPLGYALSAIAAGTTIGQVKAELFDRLAGIDRRTALANMRKRCGLPPDAA